MKKLNILFSVLALVVFISSCSKREYAHFGKSSNNGYASSSSQVQSVAQAPVAAQPVQATPVAVETQAVEPTAVASAQKVNKLQVAKQAWVVRKELKEIKTALAAGNEAEAKAAATKAIKKLEATKEAQADGKNQWVALILVLLVGGLGVHRFYLGYTWQGVVQLLTLGGCGIWALIDLIRIVTGDLKPKGGDYGTKF